MKEKKCFREKINDNFPLKPGGGRVLKVFFNALLFCFFAAKINGAYFVPMFAAWVCHELGHCGVGIYLKAGLSLKLNGMAGFGLNLGKACFGRKESLLAVAGPLTNFILAVWAYYFDYTLFYQANLVLAVGNLLPILPFDGGKILRGLFSRYFSWLVLTKLLIYFAQVLALVFAALIIWFHLNLWLFLIPVLMYILAVSESRNALWVLEKSLILDCGNSKKKKRLIRVGKETKIYKAVLKMSPGYENFVILGRKTFKEEFLLTSWLNGRGDLRLQEL